MTGEPPPATGERLHWSDVPARVRAHVENELGSRVVDAHTHAGGFSPGAAATLTLDNGRCVFVKAVGPEPNPTSPDIHRRELVNTRALPAGVPVPELLFGHDDGEWVLLCFEHIDGHQPHIPWRDDELSMVLDALTAMSHALTPAPFTANAMANELVGDFDSFAALQAARDSGDDDMLNLSPYVRDNLDELVLVESGWREVSAGDTLLHADIRADNLLIAGDRVYVVDWPHTMIGAAWVDLLFLLPSISMQGGPDPESTFTNHALGRAADPDAATAVLCALTGFFVVNGRKPAPPGLGTLRPFQQAQGAAALAWVRARLAGR